VALPLERKAGEVIRWAVEEELVSSVHDVADGGILVAVAEMALAGGKGVTIDPDWREGAPQTTQMFGEDQGRYLVTVTDGDDHRVIDRAKAAGLQVVWLGVVGGDEICIGDGPELHNFGVVSLNELRRAHEGFFPDLMGGELTAA
jgi:phosphoribosylformylglycinamidine synthase